MFQLSAVKSRQTSITKAHRQIRNAKMSRPQKNQVSSGRLNQFYIQTCGYRTTLKQDAILGELPPAKTNNNSRTKKKIYIYIEVN